MAGWDPLNPGIGEARLYAMENLIKPHMADLSTALLNRPLLSYVISDYVPIDDTMCGIGDLEGCWKVEQGCLRVRISAGDKRTGLDATGKRLYIGGYNMQDRTTAIYVYFHPDIFLQENFDQQGLERAIALEVISDWLFDGILNVPSNGEIPLTSTIYQESMSDPSLQSYDAMQLGICSSLIKGYWTPPYGVRSYYGIHAIHESTFR